MSEDYKPVDSVQTVQHRTGLQHGYTSQHSDME